MNIGIDRPRMVISMRFSFVIFVVVFSAISSLPHPAKPLYGWEQKSGGIDHGHSGSPQLWGGLAPGPYAVGFRSSWKFDPSRIYNMTFGDKTTYAVGKAPRPLLINLWYPAERATGAKPMPHAGYYEIATDDPTLEKYAAALAGYERTVVVKELFDKSAATMSDRERRLLDLLWATPTACFRDARPLDRKGSVVIYHCGAQSSYEDNSVLCEFLASHGYVVIGGAFPQASGSGFNIDGGEGSARDIAFLIGYASRLPFADWNHVAIAGHSAGAQASLLYASKGSTPVDAVVSLDTTQDYASLSSRGWEDLVAALRESPENLSMPILFAANAHAVFEMADTLGSSARDYLTFKDLQHNDFISQGLLKRMLDSWSVDGMPAKREPAAPGSPEASYEALCGYVLAFLDAHLRRDPSRQEALDASYRQNTLGGSLPHVERVPVGVTAAKPYRDSDGVPPEPRQVRGLLKELGPEATSAILRSTREKAPNAPVFAETVGFALIDELLARERTADAVAIYRLYGTFDPKFRRRLVRMGRSYLEHGMKKSALRLFEEALLLDPDDNEAAEQLKVLRREMGMPRPE